MLTLGIETSCDETAVAVVAHGHEVRSNIIASQYAVHAPYGGVVPELACRSHAENLPTVMEAALEEAQVTLAEIDVIAVTQGPGLVGALLVGVSFAKALAYALRKPLVPVHHLEGHINAIYLEHHVVPTPYVALVVSGGHSDLYYCPERGHYVVLGRTRDDAAGECFDKIAKMLHLGYPGGPVVDRLAQQGKPTAVVFPRAMLDRETLDVSFSGLKTAVRTHMLQATDPQGALFFQDDTFWPLPISSVWEQYRNDIVASFQQAVVDVLVTKTMRAVTQTASQAVVVVGGVACNSSLRREMQRASQERALPLFFPSPILCTDNAAMIACAAAHRYQVSPALYHGQDSLNLDACPNLPMPKM
ncbi:MAG: tRNA (adenosine(37)-N6)-threonylcarbamoyltransferase complex transferase subunit TsaD [Candidatus Tectomicrobia bacterium]|uniref:tRNA N6-adenosine threonylcarbamoyltransferase n=1 Tax=Tectimicrobiota bacterium TaxID=2528274 RepID=A0A937W2N3_UNCTE|nr:tRNA (adenosine(37)-N6)-threonylcarbamoyltransferase complex transferase subunit TsaD [Candidatus Tectomicrobia bacterium]